MPTDNHASLLERFPDRTRPTPESRQPLGSVVSVGGSQVIVQFANEMLSVHDGDSNVTVGTFLGIWNGFSLVIGALCELSLAGSADGRRSSAATGRVDLLGELIQDQSGAGYFQRGVMIYPRIGSVIVPIGNNELRIIFDAAGPDTIRLGHLQQDSSIGAYVDVDEMVRKHFAIFRSTGAGKSSGVALILREIMEARQDLRMLLIDPHNEYGACFDERAHVVRPGNLRLPFWLFNFDEIVEVIFGRRPDVEEEVGLLAELIPLAKNEFARSHALNRAG